MAVPSRVEACRLLLAHDPPGWLVAHSAAVAEVAAFIARSTARRGVTIDRRLVETAALLHDLDKALPVVARRGLAHGHAGAAWLTQQGYVELAPAVAGHPVTRLTDERFFPDWWSHSSVEERIVAYADKRAQQRIVPLDARFAEWRRRYPDPSARQAVGRERAERLEREVCEVAGIAPGGVRRLRWVARAMAAAGSGTDAPLDRRREAANRERAGRRSRRHAGVAA